MIVVIARSHFMGMLVCAILCLTGSVGVTGRPVSPQSGGGLKRLDPLGDECVRGNEIACLQVINQTVLRPVHRWAQALPDVSIQSVTPTPSWLNKAAKQVTDALGWMHRRLPTPRPRCLGGGVPIFLLMLC